MSAYRIILRWALTLVAVGLVLVALLSGGLRLAISQIDLLRGELNERLTRQFDATMQLGELQGSVHGLDPALAIDDLHLASHIRPGSVPLLDIEHARARLDVLASLRAGYPVLADTRISRATLHLYQDDSGRWRWPEPADMPSELVPETDFEIETVDAAVGVLLRQQAVVDDLRLALHGIDGEVTLVAPRVLMTGDGKRAHLEGELFVEGEQARAIETVLEVLPGQRGLEDFNAALRARADLSVLSRLGAVLTGQQAAQVDSISGEAELWGRWHAGRLEDVRATLGIDRLALNGSGDPLVLNDIAAKAQWLRGERDDWQAWINSLSMTDDQGEPSPLPERLHAEGDNQGWQLNSTAFDLGLLSRWMQRLPLPEALQRTLDTLSPEGRVSGLAFGWRDGQWQARAALQGAAVSPWKGAPGGGPLDAWVQAQDGQGSVRFRGLADMTLAFPEVFADPLELSEARGEVDWVLDEGRLSVGGEDLNLTWRDARVEGGFRFVSPRRAPPELELSLDFRDVNAIDTPLVAWLPVKVLDAELLEWLSGGIAGRVPQGSFYLRQTLDDDPGQGSGEAGQDASVDDDEPFTGELRLALQVEEGRLPYDPEWPALENVGGELTLHDESLRASVTHAETHGLVSEGGEVSLEDERLTVQAPVGGSTQALLDFLAASPIEGSDVFAQWRSDGRVDGRVDLGVPMSDTDALELEVAARVDAPQLTFSEVDLSLGNLNGDLRYRHASGDDFLTGTLGARAFEGPLLADFDVGGDGIVLEGRALARGLLQWAGMSELESLLSGYFPYTARLDLAGERPRLSIDSNLQGLGIQLPAPFGKRQAEGVALQVDTIPGQRLSVVVADRMRLGWRSLDQDSSQGQVWLERWPETLRWPNGAGWQFVWQTPRIDIERWQSALAGLGAFDGDQSTAPRESLPSLRNVQIDTQCLLLEQRCLGSLQAALQPQPQGWRFDLGGSLVEGRGEYRPGQAQSLSLSLTRLALDSLIEETPPTSPELAEEIATTPDAVPLPSTLSLVPDGRITIDRILRKGRELGPLSAQWEASSQRLNVAPLSLRLGEVEVGGELTWESAGPQASLTRSRIALTGGDIGTLFESLDQPVALRSEETDVRTQLAWPGAPWQFALERSRGNIGATLRDGRFLTLDSSSAKLIGLLNIDNLLRRLRLDFTDVTGRGTAFDSVQGDATLYDGRLETRGPVEIDGPSTQFSLDGSVDLIHRQLDLSLGVTVPISQNLPLAAVLIGAPYVGGALFLADKMFGGWIDKVTRIYYRVQGSWASPRITVENAE
ncbi:TIGR02099 family protein [Modicisalibacter ilicicola DSM 19980]|uniref:TIGR02099 family protein n=1 Tax=Modicisalibacter ilicicola DSM 19980 TaxID=1121942 RepID=A0A1M5C8X7_9GAMM|nr:AsmA-like C-terminal region-containing protein [Halomonas ilicicola]SHF51188.1 TIGR02099 family protein [Halomonas ilicicola DSM 19980]